MSGRSTTVKSIPLSPTRGKNLNLNGLRAMLVMLLFVLGVESVWAGGGTRAVRAVSYETAKGLVYASLSNSSNPNITDYTTPSNSPNSAANYSLTDNPAFYGYLWAMPSRGYVFSKWTTIEKAAETDTEKQGTVKTNTGSGDELESTVPREQNLINILIANFGTTTGYDVVYKQPDGGKYTVKYEYYTVNESTKKFNTDAGETLQLTPTSGDKTPTDPRDATNHKTYKADVITLTATEGNFIAWYKDGVELSKANPYTKYQADDDAEISALFQYIVLGNADGDLTVNATVKGKYNRTVYVYFTQKIGPWVASAFTISPKKSDEADASNDYGTIEFGDVSIDETNNRLVIPYAYTATDWGGISVDVTIAPPAGAGVGTTFSLACSAEEVVDYEARIEIGGEIQETGTLAEMMDIANGNTYDNPTIKLMNPVTITSPLSFNKSMTFDVYGQVLTANCASAFSIDAANTDVKIVDGSFTQVGEIHTSNSSASPVSVVTFTKKAKLTMNGGTLSAANTGAGAAYGVDVQQGSVLYMTGGNLTVTANTGNAQGVHVATASDYATFAGGVITVTAPTNAYGVWSAGSSNITNATINAQTTATTGAYGIYVNGGISTLEGNTTTVVAATNNAFGAYVNAGRLNNNGGSFTVKAASDVTGVHIAAGATALLQQNASVTATATGASGTNVLGINNLGTVSLANITVTATSPTTAATAVNSATSAVSTTIDGGTYSATADGGTAYALHHQYGALNVDGGTFRAIGSGNNVYGARAIADGTITNATIAGETRGTGNTAYGFVGGVANKNITLTNCAITGQSNTSKAYAIYSRANVTAIGCTLTATTLGADYAYGFYAENGTNNSVNTNATVSSYTTQAYGVYHAAGSMSVNGGEYNVQAKQTTAGAEQSAYAYGLYNISAQTTNTQSVTFRASSGNNTFSQDVYGAYINGTLRSANCTYEAQAKLKAYGIWGHTASDLELKKNTITSTTINGTTSYGIYAKKQFSIEGDIVRAIGSTTDVYAMFFDASTSEGDVLGGKFTAQGNGTNGYGALNASGTVGKVRLKGGVYKTTINLQKYAYTGYQVFHLDETHEDYADGYRYTIATQNPSPYVCRIVGGAYYATLEAALQYTQDHSGTFTIVMTQNYTLPAGDYVLPSNSTLIVPRKFGQTTITETEPNNPNRPDYNDVVGLREDFLCLTIASDAHLNVDGKIGVSGDMYCKESGHTAYNNAPFGHIYMKERSHIQLNSGAYLYAWGFITGTGTITVKSNAEVHEMFHLGDMKTVGNIVDGYYGNSDKFFWINQYSIQNIEVPTTYYYNARLVGSMHSHSAGEYPGGDQIKLVDTNGALFEVTSTDESSWVRKSYDAVHDYQVWEVNSSAQLGSITMKIATYSLNSANFILPITSNMKIHILDGNFAVTQDTELLPGSTIEINKTASLTINEGKKLYVFDKDQWPLTTATCSPEYSPSWPNGIKPSRTANDAAINVHGSINVQEALYTTNPGGANIYSNNADAGTIFFEKAAPSTTTTINLITGVANKAKVTKTVTMDPALLKNGAGASPAFTPTSGTAKDHSFAYMNNVWTQTYTNDCFEVVGEDVYVKPSDYVKLKKTQNIGGVLFGIEEENHTYVTADDKLLIVMSGCQWWEVEATSDPAVFECKKDGYEGFYYYDEYSESWQLKTVTVTFYSKEEGKGDDVHHTIVTDFNGRPNQSVIPSNPTKETTTGFTYQFYGWKSSETGTTYKWTDPLEVATADMSYRPVFTETKRNYTITLIDAKNGATVPVEVPYDEVPSYEAKKDPTAQYTYTFDHWDPELQPVSGPATYTAIWSSIVNRYTITWMDGETVLETDKHQPYGTATSFGGTLPTKETDDNFVYTFNGWKSSLTGTTYANGSTPAVEGETTYSAQYNTTPRYMISFINYDGSPLQKEAFTQGVNPVYNGETPGRKRDFDGYYSFTGWKNSDGTFYAANATLPAVTAKETYTAQYTYVTDLFEITLNNVDGNGGTWSGYFGEGSTPFYDPNNDDVADKPTKAGNAQYSYPFTGWTPALEPVSETGIREYTAQFGEEINSYTITFANVDGYGAQKTVDVKYGQTPECPVTPTKENGVNSYAFTGWNKSIVPVVGEETYTATFSSTPTVRQFDITFDLDNGSPVTIVPITYGTTPEWTGETPTKPATAQYTYTFAGWYPTLAPVTGNETYTAQYTQSLNSYTVTFKNYDGTVLDSKKWQYGTTPSYSGTTPEKPFDEANAKFYTFSGWSPAIGTVTGEATYTAQYTESALVATVTTAGGATTPYNSWTAAYNDRAANCTIKLYKDVTGLTTMQALDKTGMTLDLNGHTMSGTFAANRGIVSSTATNVTITDSSVGKTGTISSSASVNGSPYVLYVNGGSLTIDYANVSANNTRTNSTSNAYGVYVNSGTVVINDGKFKATSSRANGTKNAVYIKSGQTATIKGGYYSNSVTPATGYQCVTTSELSGYTHKVIPVVYTITLNKGTRGRADGSATVDFAATALKSFNAVTAAGYDCTGYFDGETKVLNADGSFAGENVSGYITGGKWSKASTSTLTAQWSLSRTLEAHNGENIPVAETATVDATIIHAGGIVEIETDKTLTTTVLILEATSNSSGQLVADEATNIAVTSNAYFDLTLNTPARHWHAFGVPWQVDVNVNPLIELETGRTLVVGRDCEIVYYNGAKRASEGAGAHCWEYLKHYDGNGSVEVMTPGKGYMIAFTSHVGTVRFTKAAEAPVIFSGKVNLAANDGEAPEDNGWNAMANPMAYHATMKDGPSVGYVHDGGEIGSDGYIKYDLSDRKFIVGKMVYVQSDGDEVTPEYAGSTIEPIVAAAPARRKAATNKKYLALSDYYRVGIENAAGVQGGDVCVLPEDDKTETYVIGHDLSQFGMNAAKPQLWINRYGTKLALNTTAPLDGVADFPMSVYAPAAGEYTIALAAQPDDENAVYLTKDGEVIWNLSDGACTLTLTKGTAADYGLRLGEKKAPEVATGFGEAVVDAHGKTTKVLIDGKVFIIREDRVYTIDLRRSVTQEDSAEKRPPA